MTKFKPLSLLLATSMALSTLTLPAVAGNGKDYSVERWAKKVSLRLDRHMTYPSRAAVGRDQGLVKVHAKLSPDGEITDTKLIGSSGSEYLDKAAMKLTKRLGDLPKPPTINGKQVKAVQFHLLYALAPQSGRMTAAEHALRRALGRTEIEDIVSRMNGQRFAIVFETDTDSVDGVKPETKAAF